MARPTDDNRAMASIPPGQLLKGIQEIAAAMKAGKRLNQWQQQQVAQLMQHLSEYSEDVFLRMDRVREKMAPLRFQNEAAKELLYAEISRYFLLVDKTERAKCWDRLNRALVDQPPKEHRDAPKNSTRIGGHVIDRPGWLDES